MILRDETRGGRGRLDRVLLWWLFREWEEGEKEEEEE